MVLASGCEKAAHDMYDQPKYKTYRESALFVDGKSEQAELGANEPYARGTFARTSSGRIGANAADEWRRDESAASNPYPITAELLQRGQNRFNVFCVPCHGYLGDGKGIVVKRGFPAPPSYHGERLRDVPDRHIFDVITHGFGVMYPYSDRVAPSDRWAIVAYIRALQMSQHARVAELTNDERRQLGAVTR